MRQKGIAFFLVICMLLAPIGGSVSYAEEVDARAAGTEKEAVQNETDNEAAAGLLVADWIDWDDDGNPVLNENAEYKKETGADILWGVTCSVTNDGEPVSANDLHVYRQNDDAWEAADDVTIAAHEKNEELLQFSFTKTGRYHISLSGNDMGHADPDEENESEGDDCIKLWVGYPDIAFYDAESNGELSEEHIIKKTDDNIRYSAGDFWYVYTRPQDEYNAYSEVSFEPWWSTPELLFDVEKLDDGTVGEGEETYPYQRYKVTAKVNLDFSSEEDPDWSEIGIRVSAEAWNPQDEEQEHYWCELEQRFQVEDKESVKKGLLETSWTYEEKDEDDESTGRRVLDTDLNGFEKMRWVAPYDSLGFKYNDGKSLEEFTYENEEGEEETGYLLNSAPLKTSDIKIYTKDEDGKLVEASEDSVTYKPNEEVIDLSQDEGKQMPAMIDFSFKKVGSYLVSYTPEGGEESCAIVEVGYPDVAFYTRDKCTVDGLLHVEKSYSRNDRTFYLVLHQYEMMEEGEEVVMYPQPLSVPTLKEGRDKVKLEKQSDTVYKLTVNTGVKEAFDVEVEWSLRDENGNREEPETSFVHLFYEAVPEVTALTVTPKTAEIEIGKTVQLSAQAKSEDGTAAITYQSADDKIATVDNKGVVTGVKAGKTEITVTAKAGDSTKTEKVAITVKEAEKKNPAVAQKNVTASNGSKVTTAADGTATVNTAYAKKNAKSVKVADKVVVNGAEYTVTAVGANAFKSVAKTVTSVTLPTTITKIDKNAFKGLKKLKKITMKVTAPVTVAKGAFKGVDTKKVTITVSKKMSKKDLANFKKALKKAGFKGTVKAK